MTNSDRVFDALIEACGPVCDDCMSKRAGVRPRQQVHRIATQLARDGRISRDSANTCAYCGISKKVSTIADTTILPRLTPTMPTPSTQGTALGHTTAVSEGDSTRPWHWEGNVQVVFRSYLESTGWTIMEYANTASKKQGVDVTASNGQRKLVVEVKGYPGVTYEHGSRRGLSKPTRPASQARQWFSHALLSILLLRHKQPTAEVALCFPDFPTYRALIESTRGSLELLGVGVYLVSETGIVTAYIEHYCIEDQLLLSKA